MLGASQPGPPSAQLTRSQLLKLLSYALKLVAQGAVVTPLEAAFLPLAFPGLNQVLQTPRALHSRLPTFSTPSISLHAQLILPLPRDGQVRVLVFDALSHLFFSPPCRHSLVSNFSRACWSIFLVPKVKLSPKVKFCLPHVINFF